MVRKQLIRRLQSIYYTSVLPVLIYGPEVTLPKITRVDKLEKNLKKFLKQVLSVPDTTAYIAIFTLTEALPFEAVIHKNALTLFELMNEYWSTSIK